MNNQYAVLISSEIPELGELDLLRSIYRELNGYMEDYNNQINLDDLGDWKLLIQINLRNTNGGIGIFKRAKRFPSNKEFEIYKFGGSTLWNIRYDGDLYSFKY
jgi:hypothetical protein